MSKFISATKDLRSLTVVYCVLSLDLQHQPQIVHLVKTEKKLLEYELSCYIKTQT